MRSNWLICEYCDSVYRPPALVRHQKAHCRRCGAVLQRPAALSIDQLLALSVTAAILLLFVHAEPLMDISMQGLHQRATLLDAIWALSTDAAMLPLALLSALAVILAPALQVTLLLWVLIFARQGQRAPGFVQCMLWLEHLRPWSMLEVCMLGALVAVIKLSGMLSVMPGAGLVALAGLGLLILGLAGRNVRHLWEVL